MQDNFEYQVLEALVSGYLARDGMKERFRSLSEYEIARRLGITGYSYVEYDASAERIEVRGVLSSLQQRGLVSFVRPSGRYDAFAPTERGTTTVTLGRTNSVAEAGQAEPPENSAAEPASAPSSSIESKLDEIIALLRSIEGQLSRQRPAN